MIVKELKELNQPCEPCSSVEEGEEIAAKLLDFLNNSETGIGLAANQIGINKRVCVINCKDPVVLVNPEIVEKSEELFVFGEGCLSFPDTYVKTKRHKWVKVKADNHKSELMFSVWNVKPGEEGYDKNKFLDYAYEVACVQHEIDHLDGVTMFDREFVMEPTRRAYDKIGRNEKVEITNGKVSKMMKWKKAEPLIKTGDWSLSYGTVEVVE
jgi:peptide deformylase